MKTRVASINLDTHSEDIVSVASEAESEASDAFNRASSFAETNYSENIKEYEESTGIVLDSRFGKMSTQVEAYSQAASEHMKKVNHTLYSQGGELNIIQGINTTLKNYWDNSMLQPTRSAHVTWNQDPESVDGGSRDGDIHWSIPHQNDEYDYSEAVPFKKVDGEWKEVSFQQLFFGSEIYGGKIQGGKLIGVNFESQFRDGKQEAFFHVNSHGVVHAQNFNANIMLAPENARGHNGRWYSGGFTTSGQGFAVENGIMRFGAWAYKMKDVNNNYDKSDFDRDEYYAQTFIEPNGLKQRAYDGKYNGVEGLDPNTLIARTDIRSGRIDINDKWPDNTGFTARPTYLRVGTWNDKGEWSKKSGVVLSYYGDFHKLHVYKDSFICNPKAYFDENIYASSIIYANGGIISRTEIVTNGGMTANNPIVANKGLEVTGNINNFGNTYVGGMLVANNIIKSSDLSIKKNIEKIDSEFVLAKILATDIVRYEYKDVNSNDRTNIGPVIDDENNMKQYYLPEELVNRSNEDGKDTISMDNYISYLTLSIQELAKQNRELIYKVAKLERKVE